MSELYRHMLERAPDGGAQHWQNELASGRMTVREVVRNILTSQEHQQRFGQTEGGEGVAYERAVARLYRHALARQPDAEGQRVWAQRAQQNGINSVVDPLINSQEYSNNFGDWGVPGSGGMRFCPTNTSSRVAPAPQAPPPGQVTEYRFRGMDRNNDGVVTRNEWRGSRQSFNVHDWDGNGVLEGNEVRTAAGNRQGGRAVNEQAMDREERFYYLDVNGNNRIDRREWRASIDSFNALDRNRDGGLTLAELNATTALDDGNVGIGTTGDVVIVDSTVPWTDTGITVRAGQTLRFDAEGRIQLSDNGQDFASAGGSTTGRRAQNAPVPSAPAGGLIARIGNRAPVYVGDRRAVRAPVSGRLFIGVNDDHLADNRGDYRVTIDVQ